jgi:hypothetical protein
VSEGATNLVDWRVVVVVDLVRETWLLRGWETDLLPGDCGVVRISPSPRGSVDFCIFGKVFSRSLGVGHVEIVVGTTLHS